MAGAFTHLWAGQTLVDACSAGSAGSVSESKAGKFLAEPENRLSYLTGIVFPDQGYTGDQVASIGKMVGVSDLGSKIIRSSGEMAHWSAFVAAGAIQATKMPPGKERDKFTAFLMGALSHDVIDLYWHQSLVNILTDYQHCDLDNTTIDDTNREEHAGHREKWSPRDGFFKLRECQVKVPATGGINVKLGDNDMGADLVHSAGRAVPDFGGEVPGAIYDTYRWIKANVTERNTRTSSHYGDLEKVTLEGLRQGLEIIELYAGMVQNPIVRGIIQLLAKVPDTVPDDDPNKPARKVTPADQQAMIDACIQDMLPLIFERIEQLYLLCVSNGDPSKWVGTGWSQPQVHYSTLEDFWRRTYGAAVDVDGTGGQYGVDMPAVGKTEERKDVQDHTWATFLLCPSRDSLFPYSFPVPAKAKGPGWSVIAGDAIGEMVGELLTKLTGKKSPSIEVLVAMDSSLRRAVVGAALDEDLDLSFEPLNKVPLVGPLLQNKLTLRRGRVLYASESISASDIDGPTWAKKRIQGFLDGTPSSRDQVSVTGSGEETTLWFNVGLHVGPLAIRRIGTALRQQRVWCFADASFDAGVLRITTDGLGIGLPGSADTGLQFALRGMSLSYKSPPIEISGSFLANQQMNAFAGEAILSTGTFSLSATGMYGTHGGFSSAFLFATLSKPLGGPPYFFVTGLAAGFGYNSRVVVPPIEGVPSHALVARASGSRQVDTEEVLRQLIEGQAVRAEEGHNWLAAGLSFTSFELIKSTALVVVQFGNGELELELLGVSSISLPRPPLETLARIEMAVSVVVQPMRGVFQANARITENSFLLDPRCKPRGGFAFWAWYGASEHAGDFVLTIGGYHPKFRVPAHYPQASDVPRLSFDWPIKAGLSMTGSAYFALTPSAVMVGGRLEVAYTASVDAKIASVTFGASLTAWMDALVEWAPFHFEVSIGVSVAVWVKAKFLFISKSWRLDLGVKLDLWGPPTGGAVTLDLSIISVKASFGPARRPAPKLPWTNGERTGFADALLPREVLTVRVTGGLVSTRKDNDGEVWIVRPDDFRFSVTSAIPATSIADAYDGAPLPTTLSTGPVHIRPMGISLADTTLTIGLRDSTSQLRFKDHYTVDPVCSNIPAAKWGAPLDGGPTLNGATETVSAQLGFAEARATEPPTGVALRTALETISYARLPPPARPSAVAPFGTWPPGKLPPRAGRDDAMQSVATALAATGAVRQAIFAALSDYGLRPGDPAKAAADPFAGKPGLSLGGAPLLA